MRRTYLLGAIERFSQWPRRSAFAAVVGGSIACSFFGCLLVLVGFATGESVRVWTISLISSIAIPAAVASTAAHVLLTMTDALQAANEEIRALADTDDLTGALNRRRFSELAREALSTDFAAGHPTSLILMDVDNFKNVNDSIGHSAGDAVLQILVTTCRRSLREGDVIARWGGEEFVILFPETSSEEAFAIADRMRAAIAAEDVRFDGERIALTVSTGLVTRTSMMAPTFEVLVSDADKAMYEAKTSGKNKVIAASSIA